MKNLQKAKFDEVHLNCECVDGSIVNGRRENLLVSFSFSAPPGFKNFKQFRSILLKKVNIDKIGDIAFYLEDDDGKIVEFQGETSTSSVVKKSMNEFSFS